jgi:polysaccharide export outer membrane protein
MKYFSFKKRLLFQRLSLYIVLLLLFSSCVDSKKAIYFNNIRDTTFKSLGADIQQVIQKHDLLSISVSSLNPEATFIFNTPNVPTITTGSSTGSAAGSTQMTGYLVNQEGTIQFPVLGTINVAGLTKKVLTDTITNRLVYGKLLVDPIVTVRFLNFRVTVLGEVARPTVVSVPNERISILEALGIAGDLTIYAKRDNVLLIREENGNKMVKRVNLNSSEILSSPYYYLRTNDIVYVEPNTSRIASTERSQQLIPIAFSALSLLVVLFSNVFRN